LLVNLIAAHIKRFQWSIRKSIISPYLILGFYATRLTDMTSRIDNGF